MIKTFFNIEIVKLEICLNFPHFLDNTQISMPKLQKSLADYYLCNKQGYCNRVLDVSPVINLVHRMINIRNGKFKFSS